MRKGIFLVVLLILPITIPVGAWNARGHRIVAAIAYEQLDSAVRQRLVDVLHAHPNFALWQEDYKEDGAEVDFGLYLFMRASTWPDEIRRRGSPYDHPEWHFADYPLTPPDFPVLDRPSPENDILFGIDRNLEAMLSDDTGAEERAAHLSWLLHLVGDLHQPMHASSLVSADYPEGDRGGNMFYVRVDSRAIRLHSLWDYLPGFSREADDVHHAARVMSFIYRNLETRPAAQVQPVEPAPESWILESRRHAVEEGYLHGALEGAPESANAVPVPQSYMETARDVARERLVLAGDRLALLIERMSEHAGPDESEWGRPKSNQSESDQSQSGRGKLDQTRADQ